MLSFLKIVMPKTDTYFGLFFIRSQSVRFFKTALKRRLKQGACLLAHWTGHRRLLKILRLPDIKPLVQKNPIIAYKYLGDYISPHFTLEDRRKILEDHYHYIHTYFPQKMLLNLVDGVVLWRNMNSEKPIRIELTLAEHSWMEGELLLKLFFCDQVVYTLTFTVIQGQMLGIDQTYVLLVGGLQGTAHCIDMLRKATKINEEVHPSAMLLVVLQAIGHFGGMATIAGISTNAQYSGSKKEIPTGFHWKYDRFWIDHGGRQHNEKVFCLATTLRKHASAGSHHKALRKRQLRFKSHVVEEVIATMDRGN
jgi:uncharacterized protein VirK/YbjX